MEILIDNVTFTFPDRPTELMDQCQGNKTGGFPCATATLLGILYAYPFPALLACGIIGNALTVTILGFKSARLTRQNVYLCGVAFADTLHLLVVGLGWLYLAKGLPWATGGARYMYVMNYGMWPCRLYRFFAGLASIHSFNAFVLVAVDRCLTMYFPFEFMHISSKLAVRLTVGTLLVSLLTSLPFLLMMGYVTVPADHLVFCWLTIESQAFQFYDALYVKGIAQTLVIFVINLALLSKITQISRKRKRLQGASESAASVSNAAANAAREREAEESKATLVIVGLSIIFLICTMPAAALGLVNFVLAYQSQAGAGMLQLIWNWLDISLFLIFIQQATKWIVYLVQSDAFRSSLAASLRYKR